MASHLELEVAEGIGWVWISGAGAAVNTLGRATLADFEGILERLEGDSSLVGAVILAREPGRFLAGADLGEARALDTPEQAGGLVARGQELLERWAALPVPTVAALGGAALGGGLEVALACTHRVAVDDPALRLGLPEVQLGLIPGLGGTYRLPRRVGLAAGVKMLLEGRRLNVAEALRAGLVDEVVSAQLLARAAVGRLRYGPRDDGPRAADRLLGHNALGRKIFFQKARQQALARTGGHYPAPERILDAVETGYVHGRRAALAAEARAFGELVVSPVGRRLMDLFLAMRELGGEGDEPKMRDASVGVVGAGFMGSGIAAAVALSGHRVRLVDSSPEALGRGLAFCVRRFEGGSKRHKISRQEARRARNRVVPSLQPTGLTRADLVIEAVVEELEVKRPLFARLEGETTADTVLASNTSTIPIAVLAASLERPERLIGLHFFSPVHRMPLVEIIRHAGSSEAAVGRGLAFVRSLGKTPIVVNDGPGFYTSRILSPYLAQGAALVLEGASIRGVDGAARAAGFPVGPLELLDEVGIDVAAHAAETMVAAFPERMPYPEQFRRLVGEGRLGRKRGLGFYDYSGKKKAPDPGVLELLEVSGSREPDPREMGDRLIWAMTAEALRCLDDGILFSPRDGDVGAILGLGFPPFRGGPFRFVDAVGLVGAVEMLERLETRHGAAFAVPEGLAERAGRGGTYHEASPSS